MARHVVQHFGHVFAQLAHAAAAGRADAGAVTFGLMQHHLPRQMIGKRLARWLCARGGWRRGIACLGTRRVFGFAGLQLLQL